MGRNYFKDNGRSAGSFSLPFLFVSSASFILHTLTLYILFIYLEIIYSCDCVYDDLQEVPFFASCLCILLAKVINKIFASIRLTKN